FLKAKAPRGRRVGVVSHSGGIGSFLADKCGEMGLELPPLSDLTRDQLGTILGERGSAANPADVTGFALNDSFPAVLQTLLGDEALDVQIVASAGGGSQADTVIRAAEKCDKPLVFLWTGSLKDNETLPTLQKGPVPLFYLPGKCAKGVSRLLDYYGSKQRILSDGAEKQEGLANVLSQSLQELRELASSARGSSLTEYESKRILSSFGVPTTRETLCTSLEDAVAAADTTGYPVALKVVSADIPHKTEAGAVRLGIRNGEELAVAYEEMLGNVRRHCPHAAICGVLVQEMVEGAVELIVGVSRDTQFGPVLMLGFGGVLVEALGAASWRVCPLTASDARGMIEEVKGLPKILASFRGRAAADVEALVECLVRLSHMAVRTREIVSSLDINPLAVLPVGQGVIALDALIDLADSQER
ncbi:MAG TPA: acetate--CoA ligase family protein, partial [Chloroflexota bacterium]|nr:acetate--CoA ligase family protein [Chloroflexota bacterium]